MTETRVPLAALRLGTKFYVEVSEDERIAVEFVAPASWGLVHGVLDLPCRRLDNDEPVTVSIHREAEVTLVADGGAS